MASGPRLAVVAATSLLSLGCNREVTSTSVAVGADGLALIGYGLNVGDLNANPPWFREALKVAHCEDTACATSTLNVIDPDGGSQMSLAIGVDGLALISYGRLGDNELRVAHCEDRSCARALTSVVAGSSQSPDHTSLVIGADGRGLISYRGHFSGSLIVVHCENVACTASTLTTLDSGVGPQTRTSPIVVGSDGLGLIAYPDTSGRMKVAHCENAACTAASFRTIDEDLHARHTALAIGRDGLAVIAYTTLFGQLKVAHCVDVPCTRAELSTLDPGGDTLAGFTSVAIGADARPLIAYAARIYRDLRVIHCADTACTEADAATTLDVAPSLRKTSVAIAPDGRPFISYEADATLRVARCLDVRCTQAALTILDRAPSVDAGPRP